MKNKFIGIKDQSFFDWSSLIHFCSGLIIGVFFLSWLGNKYPILKTGYYFIFGFSLLILWEIFEQIIRSINFNYFKSYDYLYIIIKYLIAPESLLNIFSDLLAGILGLFIVYLILK